MKKVDRKKFEQKLVKLRETLTRNYRETALESAELDDGTQDYIDFATRSYTKEFLLSLSNMERKRLQDVEAALRRVQTDDYGLCVACGDSIARKRLTAAPWVELCLHCQEEQEKGMARGGRGFQLLDEAPDSSEE